ncbi:4'-phosphopantetheinyl transferase superfamily protein [Mixta intestinalis]|nr:4'-phosphopantetheinyl transferase superfamily protein [Mixta intestinalis]
MTEALLQAGLIDSTPRRRREFICGRQLLMYALKLTHPPGRLPSGAPDISAGYGASLSHSGDSIVMISGPDDFLYGVDIEPLLNFRSFPAVVNRMATQAEATWFYGLAEEEKSRAATLLFSAKETLLKMVSGLNPSRISFRALRSVRLPEKGQWRFSVPYSIHKRCEVVVYYKFSKDDVITWTFLHREGRLPCERNFTFYVMR